MPDVPSSTLQSTRVQSPLVITLCTYNERDNLLPLIREIHQFAPDADVVVVDDNSPDGTGQLADELAAADARIRVLHRPGKQGLGSATVAGFRYGVEHGYELLINMDADFSHHPRYLPQLRACLDIADVSIGSRYVPGGGVVGWSWLRYLMSGGINAYARLLLGLTNRDNSGSFRCYRVSKLAQLDFDQVRSRGYSFQEEILYMCRCVGCRFQEVPIIFEDRRAGTSKINGKESVLALWIIARLAVDRLTRRRVTL